MFIRGIQIFWNPLFWKNTYWLELGNIFFLEKKKINVLKAY
jgi:hypothetical protein